MKMKKLFNNLFCDLETSIKSTVFALIPIATFFSVMSDRTPYNYFNIAVYGVVSILILFYVIKYKSFKFDVFTLLILAFNFSILISQIVNNHILQFPRTIILLSLFSILLYQFFINVKNKESVFIAILIGGLLFAIYFIVTYRNDLAGFKFDFSQRLGRDFSDQNDLCKYLAIFAIISCVCAFKFGLVWKIPFVVSALLFFILILLTGSISGLLCFLITFIITIILCVKRQNRLIAVVVIAGLILIFVVLIQLPAFSYFKTRIEKIFAGLANTGENYDGSAVDRMQLFKESFRLFVTKPLFGYGYDQVQNFTHGRGMFSHNNFTELGASFGIVGLLIYETILLMPLIKSIKEKKTNHFLSTTTIYLFIFQIFLVIFRKKIEFILLPLYFSMACYGYYPYYELKFKNRKVSFQFVKANKKRDEALEKNNNKIKVVNLFYFDDYSANYSKNIANTLESCCEITNIAISDNESIKSSDFDVLNIKNGFSLFKIRKLSFKIDEINPDVVYIDSKLLNFSYLNCVGFSKKVVCYLRDDFDEQTTYKSKSISYVVFNKNTKERFEKLLKKNKYSVKCLLTQENKVESKSRKRIYALSFIGHKSLNSKYKEAIKYFEELHKSDVALKFSIVSEGSAYNQLVEYSNKNNIDYIDFLNLDNCNIKDTLNNSKSILILSNSVTERALIKMCASCGTAVVCKNDGYIPSNTGATIDEFDDSSSNMAVGKILKINSKDTKPIKRVTSVDYDECYLQYEYMKVFML